MFSSRKSAAPSTGYLLTKSLRFRSSASAYLNRTPASASNRTTWTWSSWVKRGALGSTSIIFEAGSSGTNDTTIYFNTSNQLEFFNRISSSVTGYLVTSQVFRDPSAWYHIVAIWDSSNGTASSRMKLYINGVQVTAFATQTNPSSSENSSVNNTVLHKIGATGAPTPSGGYFDGYLAEVNFIDGQALTPSSFGETSAATGVWQPIRYTGTYGTNGFYLDFEDTSSVAALGYDAAGSNDWTVNNISLTSGSTYDSMKDVPTLTDADTANYSVLDPLDPTTSGNATLSNGNLTLTTSAANRSRLSSIGITSGKWYAEAVFTTSSGNLSGCMLGISQSGDVGSVVGSYLGSTANSYGYNQGGDKYNNAGSSAYGSSYASGNVIGIAFDCDNGTVTFYKDNVSQGTAFSSLSTSATWFIGVSGGISSASANIEINANFGQRPFAYTPPTGFKALNTFNLPTPTIGATASSQAANYFASTLYTGTGSNITIANTVNGISFQPDFVWTKSRSAATNNILINAVTGGANYLVSDSTSAESNAPSAAIQSFNSTGYVMGTGGAVNTNGATYVAWQWRANGSGSTNTAGSITSTVSANTTAGFSIVTYTGTGANATVGHGLGVAPKMVIVKKRSGTSSWPVYHANLTSASYYLLLESTSAETSNNIYWQGTAPTSTVFSIGTTSNTNENASTYVAYCFAQVAGYSAFGSYTGNGSTDGPFVFTGFRPRYVLTKGTGASRGWNIQDTARGTYNEITNILEADLSDAEATNSVYAIDVLSNGFKLRNSNTYWNGSGETYIYMAIAESPFKFSLAR